MRELMKTLNFSDHSGLSWRKYITLDDMLTDYLNKVNESSLDVFGNLTAQEYFIGAMEALNMLLLLELIDDEEYERVCTLFNKARSHAYWRHDRLASALERRERMRACAQERRLNGQRFAAAH